MNKDFLFIHIPKTAGVSIQKSNICKPENWQNHNLSRDIPNISKFFSFCFVRNPYEKVLSSYSFYKDKKLIPKYSFEEFLKNYKDLMYLGGNESVFSAARHFKYIQYDYVTSPKGKVLVNFIGRYENIDEDFKKIQLLNGVSEENLIKLEKHNTSKHSHWQDYYTDELADIVYDYWKEDFLFFDYRKASYKK